MNLSAVVKLAGMNPAGARLIHQRPELIQELAWGSPRPPANSLLFSFYNGDLFRIVVTYDRDQSEGLPAEDMSEAIPADYGTAARPAAGIIFPSIYDESVNRNG